jgi:hypothetical protein
MDQSINEDAHTVQRRQRQAELKARLGDVLEGDTDMVALDLLNLAMALWAERYPAKLTDADQAKISQNFEGATPSLIAERALSDDGLLMALVALSHTATIAIDYKAESFCKDVVDADMKNEQAGRDFAGAVQAAFKQATAQGMSTYGATSMMILFGALFGTKAGLKWPLVARPLVETLGKVMELGAPAAPVLSVDVEDQAIAAVMQQLGVTRATAKRYVDQAKAAEAGGARH